LHIPVCLERPECCRMEPNICRDVKAVQAAEINNNALTGNKCA